jgi:hypothetical protein
MTRFSAYKLAAFAALVFPSAPVLCADPPPPPEVRQLFVFAGAWRGNLELVQPGQPAQMLDFRFDCKARSARRSSRL